MSVKFKEEDLKGMTARVAQPRRGTPAEATRLTEAMTAIASAPPAPTPLQRMQALGRLKAGAMNKTETAYAEHLQQRLFSRDIAWFKFEGIKLRLADNTFYTPDFAVMLSSGQLEAHEVKGHWLDDARAKIKIAADLYPFRFLAVTAEAKKRGGGWKVEEF